jgi:hypothetical protein
MIQMMFLCFFLFVPLQIFAGFTLRGAWRIAALVPALPMLGVVWLTFHLYTNESNLWPIFLLFSSPPVLLYVVVVLVLHRKKRRLGEASPST